MGIIELQGKRFNLLTTVINSMNIPFTIKVAISYKAKKSNNNLFKLTYRKIFDDLDNIDKVFSPFKMQSLVSKFNHGDVAPLISSKDFQTVYALSSIARDKTENYFNPFFNNQYNPTGLVKGWAIEKIFIQRLYPLLNYKEVVGVSLNGGGDIQTAVKSESLFQWQVGIEDPNKEGWIIGQYSLTNNGIATSGVNKRGEHIKRANSKLQQVTIVDNYLTIADIWATAGMAAGTHTFLHFIKRYQLSGVLIDTALGPINFEKGKLINVKIS